MTLVDDEEDLHALAGEAPGLGVHLGHQGAGGIDRLEPAALRFPMDRGRHAMGGEHHGGAHRDVLELVDEDRTTLLEALDDVLVVHDLLAHVDRRAVEIEGLLHRDDRTIHSRAVAAWSRQQDLAAR